MSAALAMPLEHPLLRRGWRALLRIKLALFDRRKYESLQVERVAGLPIVVLPDVFNPRLLRSGEFLVTALTTPRPGLRVLELGSGAGAAAVFAARHGCEVVAVDINPSAVRCTRINALLNDVSIDVRQGDLFGPVADERFDLVLFNPPYYRGQPRDELDHAWRSTDVIDRFAAGLAQHLRRDGQALVVLSSDGEQDVFLRTFAAAGLSVTVAAQRDLINETLRVFRLSPSENPC